MSLATELQAIIDKISEDEVLLYTFVNGDINTVVNGAGGPYPSLAKLTSDLSTAYTKQEVDDFLALKATLESPALTGTPTAPTQSPLDNSTKIATTAYVDSSVGPSDKGFFLTEAALVAEYPTGQDGWYAVVGETDTVWTWDSDTTAWKNTDTNSQGTVTSIGITDGNGITSSGGPVTLSGDITVGLDTATQSTLASVADKAPIANPTFTGTATIPTADITTANITTGNITTANITTADITTANFNAGAINGGELSWNGQERTLNLVTGVDTTIQVGQELVLYAVNKSGATIPNGSVVSISGSQGNKPAIVLAQADTVANARKAIGVTTESILNNSSGFVTLNGKVRDLVLDDGTYGLGQVVYLSSTVAGGITNIQPDISVELGHVLANTTGGNTNGVIEVQINNESAVHELQQELLPLIAINTAKVGITTAQADAINTALQPTDPTLDSVTDNGATTRNNISVGNIATLHPTAASNDNVATGLQSASIGGRKNNASGSRATTFGGRDNTVSGGDSTAVGGNTQKVIGNESEGIGSTNLDLFSKYTSAVGAANSTIGTLNGVAPNPEDLYQDESYAKHSIILGGENIEIQHAQYAATVGGDANTIETGHHRSVILGGTGITTDATDTVFVPSLNVGAGFKMPTGATDSYILTSNATGAGTWQANEKVSSDTAGEAAGSTSVLNMVSLTQDQYNTALAEFPDTIKDTTLYIIKS